MRRLLLALLLLGLPALAALSMTAAEPSGVSARVPVEYGPRIAAIAADLRCRVCGERSLADSESSLAQSLRREVRGLIEQGKSDAEIKTWLLAHDKDFVEPQSHRAWRWAQISCPLTLLIAAGAVALVLLLATSRAQ